MVCAAEHFSICTALGQRICLCVQSHVSNLEVDLVPPLLLRPPHKFDCPLILPAVHGKTERFLLAKQTFHEPAFRGLVDLSIPGQSDAGRGQPARVFKV